MNIEKLHQSFPVLRLRFEEISHFNVPWTRGREKLAGSGETHSIYLYVPPAQFHEPFVAGLDALTILLMRELLSDSAIRIKAARLFTELTSSLPPEERPVNCETFDTFLPFVVLVPWTRFLEFCHNRAIVDVDWFHRLSRIGQNCTKIRLFKGWQWDGQILRLHDFPPLPTTKSWIEFYPSAAHQDLVYWAWRKEIIPILAYLQTVTGRECGHLFDPDDDVDDDNLHRYILLHLLCQRWPQSIYVDWLCELTGASNVAELQAALIAPALYCQQWDAYDPFLRDDCKVHEIKCGTDCKEGTRT